LSKGLALAAGAVLFGVIQAVLFRVAIPVPAVRGGGWFLNTGTGAAAVAATFLLAGVLLGVSRRSRVIEAVMVATGAIVAMVAVLFGLGPERIFPIVVMFGTFIIGGTTMIGVSVGTIAKSLLGPGESAA
jgi:hypothetical protein